jgi:hypothetical protein
MKRIVLIVLAMGILAGCATDPGIVAGNSLLATQGTIVSIRRQVAVPCQQGLIPQDACQQIGSIYEQSKPAYDAAVDATVLYLGNNTPTTQADAQAKQQQLITLAGEAAALAAKYGVKGGQ